MTHEMIGPASGEVRGTDLESVLVVQTWGIGDLIMATPALLGLCNAYPTISVDVAVGSAAAAVISNSPFFRTIFVINTRKKACAAWRLIRLHQKRYDCAIVCTELSGMIPLLLRYGTGVPVIARDRSISIDGGVDHQENHRVIKNLHIFRQVFPHVELAPPYVFVDSEAESAARKYWEVNCSRGERVIGIHIGSGRLQPSKRVTDSTWIALIRELLLAQQNLEFLLIAGPDDQAILSKFSCLLQQERRVRVLSHPCLKTVAAILRRIALVIAADTGVGHLASGVGTPVLSIVGPTRYWRTRPWGAQNQIIVASQCQCDGDDHKKVDDPFWSNRISTAVITEAVLKILDEKGQSVSRGSAASERQRGRENSPSVTHSHHGQQKSGD